MSELWKNGPSFEDGSFKVSTDSVLLASFASPKGKNGIDIGCGSGIISLIMLCTNETLHMTGIDVNEDAAETASSNIQRNGLSSRYNVICGDIREHRMLFNTGWKISARLQLIFSRRAAAFILYTSRNVCQRYSAP